MTSVPSPSNALRQFCDRESERIRREFATYLEGRAAVRQRTELLDSLAVQLWRGVIFSAPEGPRSFCLAALGGFGRRTVFPASDVDLLFLCADEPAERAGKDAIRSFCQEMWDLRLRVSPATRTLPECARLDPDNLEFTISLLDCRYLAGDRELFTHLQKDVLPQLVLRERQRLVQRLAELAHTRHGKYGNTIFHLEPNLKESPGGLRDYNVAAWLALISAFEKHRGRQSAEAFFPAPLRDEVGRALDFLSSSRCFLHYRAGRDDNLLSWEAQDEAAARGVGMASGSAVEPGAWMRAYYRHARSISRLATHMLDEIPPARSSLYRAYQQWRSRVSNPDFSVIQSRIYLAQPSALTDADFILRLFEFVARHGFQLSPDAELRLSQALPSIAAHPPRGAGLWSRLRQILALPHAAQALRAMHALGLLAVLLPELQSIDALVIRDFYHRYTVDEHSFTAIQNLHDLRRSQSDSERPYATLLGEIERPELLFLALLVHDVGKGEPSGAHIAAGMPLVESAMARLQLQTDERELVRFLVEQHLLISTLLLRRDIFDPATVRVLAERVGTTERLKMLCLLTYADIKAVNPEALTPWKAEDIWHLYVQAANYLDRSLDEHRLRLQSPDSEVRDRLHDLPDARRVAVEAFIAGLPRRYLLTHSPAAMAAHAEMASGLDHDPVQLSLDIASHLHRLTVVVRDRAGLFANVVGVLTAWGMDIVKADAFSNAAGVVVDTFAFVDPFRTLSLNPPERERFKRSLSDVLLAEVPLQQLLAARMRSRKTVPRPQQPACVTLDNDSSAHSTIVEIVAPDRRGLLYAIASVLTENACNLEVALIDTQGHVAIDVFYVTAGGGKLDAVCQQQLQDALLEELADQN